MSKRVLKQVLYGALFAAFWALIFGGIYLRYLKPAPSCFDHRQDQGEEGIDCGGPCQAICLYSGFEPLQVVGSGDVFFPDATHVTIMAQLQNPNPDYAAPSFNYTFILKDDKGHTLQVPGTSFIYAGEIKYLVTLQSSQQDFDFKNIQSITLQLQTPEWAKAQDFPRPKIQVVNQQVTQDVNGNVQVQGTLANQDVTDFSNVQVLALFFGSSGQPDGVSFTELNELPANQSESFVVSYPPITGANLNATQIIVNALRPELPGVPQPQSSQ